MPHYLATRFLRHLGPELTQAYFTRSRVELPLIDWTTSASKRAEQVLAALATLDHAVSTTVHAEFQEVDRMANDLGITAVAEEAKRMGDVLEQPYHVLTNHHDRAMYAWLYHRRLWRMSCRLAETDAVANTRKWHERADVPAGVPDIGPVACEKLGQSLSKLFAGQLRGQQYRIEVVQRDDGEHCFYALLSDLPVATESFLPNSQETHTVITERVFDVIIACPAGGGGIACYIQGGANRDLREAVFQAFAESILTIDLVPLPRHHPKEQRWKLDHLAKRQTLAVDRACGANEAAVRALWVTASGQGKRQVMFQADPDKGPDDIYQQMDEWIDEKRIPPNSLRVVRAKLALLWPTAGKRRKSLAWTVALPGTCTLKSETDERRLIGELHLKKWKIDVSAPAQRAPRPRPAA